MLAYKVEKQEPSYLHVPLVAVQTGKAILESTMAEWNQAV